MLGTPPLFTPHHELETEIKNGQTKTVHTRFQCITASGYNKYKSFEELRWEDYQTCRWGIKDFTIPFHQTCFDEYVLIRGQYIYCEGKLQSITSMNEYKDTTFEELRLEDYKRGKGPRVHKLVFGFGFGATSTPGTSGNVFGATQTNTGLFGQQNTSMVGGTGGGLFGGATFPARFGQQPQVTGTAHAKYYPVVGIDVMFKYGTSQNINIKHHCITCMKEYENKSLEELRLEDYMAGRNNGATAREGALFTGFRTQNLLFNLPPGFRYTPTKRAPAVFVGGGGNFSNWGLGQITKVHQPNSQQPNQIDSNLIKNLNITQTSVNIWAANQERRRIKPKRQLNKRSETTEANTSPIRSPFNFNTVPNKSLDTETINLETNDGYNNDSDSKSDDDFSRCDGNEKVRRSNENRGDTEMSIDSNKTILTDNSTSGLENVDGNCRGEVKKDIKNVFLDSLALKRKMSDVINIGDLFRIDLEPSSPKVTNHTKSSSEKDVCEDNSINLTIVSQPYATDRVNIENIEEDTGNKTSDITLNINVASESERNDFNNHKSESNDINTISEGSSITDTIDVSQCENNSQTDIPVDVTDIKENNNMNQDSSTDNTNNLADNNIPVIDIQFNDGNIREIADNVSINDGSNLLKDKQTLIVSHDNNAAVIEEVINLELEPKKPSQSLPEPSDQNNMTADNGETDDLNNNNNNKIEATINLFRFDAVPKPRMIVKPSKLQFIAFKSPNSKIEGSPKTISNGYPFLDPNSKNRFKFHKENSENKALNTHLQLFSNDITKPVSKDNNVTSASAPYIRKFTPFSFQGTTTADSPVISTDTATISTPTVKTTSSSVDPDLIKLLQKRNLLHPSRIESSGSASTVDSISKPNSNALPKSSSINSTSNNTPPTTFPPVYTSKALSISSNKTLPSNFGVDIINYGASTSKQYTDKNSISSKSHIAPTFKDLSVSNVTNLTAMETETDNATSSALAISKLPASMSVEKRNVDVNRSENASESSINQSVDSQESNSQPKLSTDARSDTVSVVSAFKGSSVPSLFKGKSLLKKSSAAKCSVLSNTTSLEFNKPLLESFAVYPQTETSKGSACGSKVSPVSATATSSTSSNATVVKNPFYLKSIEDSPIKKETAATAFKQFTFTNTKPAFNFSKATTVSGIFSFNPINSQPNSIASSLPTFNVLGSNTASNSASAASNSATASLNNLSSPLNQSTSQPLSSVFHNINILGDSLSQTNSSKLNTPQSVQSSNNSLTFSLSPAKPMQIQKTSPFASNTSFGLLNNVKIPPLTNQTQNIWINPIERDFRFGSLNNANLATKQTKNTTRVFKPDPKKCFLNLNKTNANQKQSTPLIEPETRLGVLNLNIANAATNHNVDKVKPKPVQGIETWVSEAALCLKVYESEMHSLVLHREKMRYNNLLISNGNVDNVGNPRNLYFFSAIPAILNQIFTLHVHQLFDRAHNDITIGFTATDPFGINVLELPEDPTMLLRNRQEYWAFKTLKFSIDEEARFILKSNGAMRFYKQRLYTEHFVDTTVTLWLFVHVKCGIKKFSLKTNEKTDLSVHHAMNEPPEDMLNTINARVISNDARPDLQRSGAASNSMTQGIFDFGTRNVDNIGDQNINLLGHDPSFNFPIRNEHPSRCLFGSSEDRNDNSLLLNPQDRLRTNQNVMCEQPNFTIDNRNSFRTPFSNITDPDLGVKQSNQSGKVNQSNLPVISKLKRQERENECIICYDKDIDCVLYTCGHSCMCLDCSITIQRQGDSKCPICRKIICDVIKIYKS